jgi:hypothetical protein
MRKHTIVFWLFLGAFLLPLKPAFGSLITGPNYVENTPVLLEVNFTFGAITSNATYNVGPFTSPGGLWGIGQINVVEMDQESTPGIPSDTVSIGGTITDLRTGNSFSYSFNFDTAMALAGIPEQFGTVGIDSFAAEVQANVSGTDNLGYGLGLGAGVATPEPSSIALLVCGSSVLGLIRWKRRRERLV